MLSCHAADPEVGAKLTRYKHDVRDTWAALSNIIDARMPVELNVVLTRWNLDQPGKILQTLAERICSRAVKNGGGLLPEMY